jgi:two-component system response regulator AlgR
MQILIVDDEAPARQRLRELFSDIHEEFPDVTLTEAENATQALTLLQARQFEIALLDVQMPGMDGMELAQQLGTQPGSPAVIFVTAHEDYALKAFELHARDYLLKPVRSGRLAQALRHAQSLRLQQTSQAASRAALSVMEKNRHLRVPLTEIIFIRAEQKYLSLHTSNAEYWAEGSLAALEDEFGDQFIRVHRNALVARSAVLGVEKSLVPTELEDGGVMQEQWQVILRGLPLRLPVSRRQLSALKILLRK